MIQSEDRHLLPPEHALVASCLQLTQCDVVSRAAKSVTPEPHWPRRGTSIGLSGEARTAFIYFLLFIWESFCAAGARVFLSSGALRPRPDSKCPSEVSQNLEGQTNDGKFWKLEDGNRDGGKC